MLGVVGPGKMMYGSHMPHYLRMPEVKLVAVAEVDTTRREAGKRRVDEAYGNSDCAAYGDHREILARDDIDAVACATPDHWHAIVILDTCKAGKDMYCEKPLTNNLMEAKIVMDALNCFGHHLPDRQPATGSSQQLPLRLRTGPQNGYASVSIEKGRWSTSADRRRPCNIARRGNPSPGLDWERWLGRRARCAPYSSVLSPRGVCNHLPLLAKLSANTAAAA